jgi:hypothetical protein
MVRRSLVVGSAAVVVLGGVSSALINELHNGWGWYAGSAAVVLGAAVLSGWLTVRSTGDQSDATPPVADLVGRPPVAVAATGAEPAVTIEDLFLEWLKEPATGKDYLSADVSMKNPGSSDVLVSRLEIECTSSIKWRPAYPPAVWYFPTLSALPPSSMTTAELPQPTGQPFTIERKLSNVVAAGGFDRIKVLLSVPDAPEPARVNLYKIRFNLIYDGAAQRTPTRWVLVGKSEPPRLASIERVCHNIEAFVRDVAETRQRTNERLAAAERGSPDWNAVEDEFIRTGQLRRELRRAVPSNRSGQLESDFWCPRHSVEEYLRGMESGLADLADVLHDVELVTFPVRRPLPVTRDEALTILRDLRLMHEQRAWTSALAGEES